MDRYELLEAAPPPVTPKRLEVLVSEVVEWCASAHGMAGYTRLPQELELQIDLIEVDNLQVLLACEELFDAMDMGGFYGTPVYPLLEQKARRFIVRHPQLLVEPWLRNGGAVYDLLESLPDDTRQAAELLSKFRLRTAP